MALVWQSTPWRLLLARRSVRRRPGLWLATRRSAVDRRTATMLYASQDRSMSMRRWLPQNMRVRDGTTEWTVGDSAGEGRVCCGGAPARRDGFGHSCADLFTVTEIF